MLVISQIKRGSGPAGKHSGIYFTGVLPQPARKKTRATRFAPEEQNGYKYAL
jgi:hypothetical protein